MPANRRRRRAQAARARQARTQAPPRAHMRMVVRLALGTSGVTLIVISVVVLVNPSGFHTGRGLFFLLLAGGALLVLAIRPR